MRKEDLMMKFRKNQNKEKQIPKEKKPRVYYKVNPHKKVAVSYTHLTLPTKLEV